MLLVFQPIVRFVLITQYVNFFYFGSCEMESCPHNDDEANRQIIPEDAYLNFTQLTAKYGYKTETHQVVTEDGYILTLLRVQNPNVIATEGPVLLAHGIIASADNWLQLKEKSWVYILADAGYDVWVNNNRGTKLSRNHFTLDPDKDMEFWDFTFHEIAVYDMPANIDYVLDVTGEKSLKYVGHSMGTTLAFILCSEKPEYNDKIGVLVAMAPVAFFGKMTNPVLRLLSPAYHLMNFFGLQEFAASDSSLAQVARIICSNRYTRHSICMNVLYIISGEHDSVDDPYIPVIFSHYPDATSAKSLKHLGQLINEGKFEKFDYGDRENYEKYNNTRPPPYRLDLVRTPVVLICGANDMLSPLEDTERLRDSLPSVKEYYVVPDKLWTHHDFVWSRLIEGTLENKVLTLLDSFKP